MKTLAPLALLAVAATHLATDATAAGSVSVSYSESLANFDLSRRGSRLSREAYTDATMRFDALGRRFELELEPNTALLRPETLAALGERLEVYRGHISGEPRSWVRLVVEDGVPSGMLYDGSELYAIEAPGDAAHGGAEPQMFRLADLAVEQGMHSCGVAHASALNGAALYDATVAELKTALAHGPGAVEEIEVGVLGDEAFGRSRANAVQAIVNRMNNVDGIYSSEFGIQITVPPDAIEVFNASNDPFETEEVNGETEAGDLLDELTGVRFNSPTQRDRGLTHLFTGRDLEGTTVGIAYIDVLCLNRFGVALTQATSGLTGDSLVAAHEIGHNFSATHDGDPDGSCPDTNPRAFIMASEINGGDSFSDCSRDEILKAARTASCITALPTMDARVTSIGQPDSVFLGNVLMLDFAVENRGSLDAEAVTLEIALPLNVTFQSATTPSQACTSGAGSVNCPIGILAGGTSQTVTLTVGTDAPGNARFTASVTADGDVNPNNNVDVHDVDVQAAVDLVANTPSSLTVVVNRQGTSSIVIANNAMLDATNVTVSIVLDAGLRPEAADWSAGSCVLSGQSLNCSAATLAAESQSTLDLTLTGIEAGTHGFTVRVTADEADRDSGNDSASGTVTVTEQSSRRGGDGGGSGGGTGLLLVAALVLALRRRYGIPDARTR